MRLPVDALIMMGLDFPLRRCGCGQHGCIENYLSGRGFAWLYQHYYHQPLQAPEIIALYDQGDEQARAHVERYLDLLAVCLGNILTIADPDSSSLVVLIEFPGNHNATGGQAASSSLLSSCSAALNARATVMRGMRGAVLYI